MKFNHDYKSRFRILKGGKISLVVSALVLGSTLNVAQAEALNVTTGDMPETIEITENSTVTLDGDLIVSDAPDSSSLTVESSFNTDLTITNGSTLSNTADMNVDTSYSFTALTETFDNDGIPTTITNNGSITVDATTNNQSNYSKSTSGTAISIGQYLPNGSTITNSGTISSSVTTNRTNTAHNFANSTAIEIYDMLSSTIDNSGTISATATVTGLNNQARSKAYGIAITNGMDSSSAITNSGTISATATSSEYGYSIAKAIMLTNTGLAGTITNSSTGAITSSSYTDDSTAIFVEKGITGTITNGGTISATSDYGNVSAIYQNDSSYTSDGTITNSGTISSSSSYDGSSTTIGFSGYFDGTIQNNEGASITSYSAGGTVKALYISNDFESNGQIINDGTISGTSDSGRIYTLDFDEDFDGDITNTATGSITATSASGIVHTIDFSNMYGTFTNQGSVTATTEGYGSVRAVRVSSDMYGTITNAANATISANSVDGNSNGIDFNNGIEDGGALVNSGTIEATTTGNGQANGLYLADDLSGTITNNSGATISVTSGSVASGIYIYGDITSTGSITNGGTISATTTDSSAYGIYIYDGGLLSGATITNTGTISATSTSGSSYGVYIERDISGNVYDGTGSFVNDGTISANTTTGDATAFKARYIYTDGSFTNNGTIEAYKDGELDATAYAIKLNANYENLENTGNIYGNIGIGNSNNVNSMVTNSGTISLPYNANGLFNATIENFTQTADGTLQIGLFTGADGDVTGNYSQLSTVNATFAAGSTIDVDVKTVSANQNLLEGEILENIVSASDSLTIEGALNITDNSALLDFEYVEDGETIDLNIIEAVTVEEAVTISGGTTSTRAAASILSNGNFSSVVSQLNALPTTAAVNQAIASTTPQAANAASNAAGQISTGISGIVNQRQNVTLGGGLNSGDEMFTNKNVWFKPFGTFGTQDDKDGINGFDLKSYGFGIGIDGEYATNQNLGVALFYTNGSVDVNHADQEVDLDVFTAMVYGNLPVIDSKTQFMYQAGYSLQQTESKRGIFTGDTAKADYTSKTASLDLKLQRDYKLTDRILLQPMVSTTYRHFKTPSYTESGAGVLNLQVNKSTSSELIVGAGTTGYYLLDESSKLVGNINLGYDLHDNNQSVTSAYQGSVGSTFSTDGIDNGRWSYDIGVGYERDIDENSNINVSYNRQGEGSAFSNNTISAKFTLQF